MDLSERLSADFIGSLSRRPNRINQRVVLIRVAVGPPIDGNGLNVVRRIEPAAAQNLRELAANVALKRVKVGGEQDHATGALFFPRGLAGAHRYILKMKHAG